MGVLIGPPACFGPFSLACPALPCPGLPCLPGPALPCPALPCPALPCPAVALPCALLAAIAKTLELRCSMKGIGLGGLAALDGVGWES